MNDGPLYYWPAHRLAQAIRAKELSSAEVVEAHLARIAQVNPVVHGVVQFADDALANARAADEALARGDDIGLLHGVPITVKDWIEVAGLVCAAGFEERRELIPRRDATVVQRMKAAGAIVLGKTTVTEGAPYERPLNPYNLERSPGGSSSGEVVMIATGGSPLGLASDSGGSIRWPAHCSGVAGLKPTSGRVPSTGHFPRISPMADPRTQIGPMARSVRDLELALRVISGPDMRDTSVVPVVLGATADVDVRSLRVAVFVDLPGAEPTDETREMVTAVAKALDAECAAVEDAAPPRLEESLPLSRKYWMRPESMSLNQWEQPYKSMLTADEVEESIFEWDRFRRDMLAFMRRFDVIVCPAAEDAAPSLGKPRDQHFIYTLPWSLTGWPALVVRAGTTSGGLPLGVQVVAQPWREDVALAVGMWVEETFGGWQAPREFISQ